MLFRSSADLDYWDGSDACLLPCSDIDFSPVIGRTIRGFWLGGTAKLLSFGGGHDIPGWCRLYLDLGEDLWLEVYNALDDNGYELHAGKPNEANIVMQFCI